MRRGADREELKIGQSTSDPGQENTLTITLTPSFSLRATSTITIGGLFGTDMVARTTKVVDCVPSPCLAVGSEHWDRGRGKLVVTVQGGQQVEGGKRLVITLLTRNPHHTKPPASVYVESGTEYLGQEVKSISRATRCPQNPPPIADPMSPAADAVTDASSCQQPGAEDLESAPAVSAPLFVRIWEKVRV